MKAFVFSVICLTSFVIFIKLHDIIQNPSDYSGNFASEQNNISINNTINKDLNLSLNSNSNNTEINPVPTSETLDIIKPNDEPLPNKISYPKAKTSRVQKNRDKGELVYEENIINEQIDQPITETVSPIETYKDVIVAETILNRVSTQQELSTEVKVLSVQQEKEITNTIVDDNDLNQVVESGTSSETTLTVSDPSNLPVEPQVNISASDQNDVLFDLALTNNMDGNHNKAIELYEQILKDNPDHKEAIYNLAMSKIELNQTKEGCMLLNKSYKLGVSNAKEMIYQHCRW